MHITKNVVALIILNFVIQIELEYNFYFDFFFLSGFCFSFVCFIGNLYSPSSRGMNKETIDSIVCPTSSFVEGKCEVLTIQVFTHTTGI